MHMADALVSPAVGLSMAAVSVAAICVSVAGTGKDEIGEAKVPIMGVAGALVFAAQMINFAIPATGSSGHIGGGVLLAGLLGGTPAFLSMTAVVIIQCLFFADGGLLALGCNIFNLGVVPCLIVYPLVFRPIIKRTISMKRLSIASVAASVLSLELGAFCVVAQTRLSGIALLPFGAFAALMLPIHLAIGAVEGVVTAAALCFIHRMRPEIIEATRSGARLGRTPAKSIILILMVAAIAAGGVLSLFASDKPDGLEWAVGRVTEGEDAAAAMPEPGGDIRDAAAAAQENTAVMPDYAFADDPENAAGTSVAGIVGAAATFAAAGLAGLVISVVKKRKRVVTDV